MAASSGDTLVGIPDDVVKCCSCHTLFDDVDRHPRLLPCLHCICYKCLQENMKSKRNISCGYCRENIDISENSSVEYPKDCSKTGYVKLNQIKNSNCSFKCHECEDKPVADFYCVTCTRHLCQYCYEYHKRAKRSHDISPLKDIPVTMETAKMFHVQKKCVVHQDENLDFHCIKCNTTVCFKCAIALHKDSEGHKVQEIHSIYKTESEKLYNEKSTVGTLENKIGKTVNAIENEIADVQKYSESVSAEISTAFEDAYKLLKRRKEDLIKEVSSITQNKTTSLQQQLSKLQKQRQDIKDILAHIKLSLDCNDHAALVDVLPMIIQKLSRLGASTTDSEPCVKANLAFMEKKLTTSTPLLGHLTTASVYGPNTQFVLPEVIYAGESVEIEVILSDYNGTAIMDQDIEVTIHVTNVASQNDVFVLTCKLTQKNTWICSGIIPTPGQYDVTVCVKGHLVKLEPKRIEVESVPVIASAQFHLFDPDEEVGLAVNTDGNDGATSKDGGKLMYKDKCLIRGFSTDLTKDCLWNYVEGMSKSNVSAIVYGDEPGKALITFKENLDFKTFQTACKTRKLMGKCITEVPVSNCLLVSGLDPRTSEDTIQFYFENQRRSGGGEIERIDYNQEEGTCLVYFIDHTVVDTVVNRTHRICDRTLELRVYHECLDVLKNSKKNQKTISKQVNDAKANVIDVQVVEKVKLMYHQVRLLALTNVSKKMRTESLGCNVKINKKDREITFEGKAKDVGCSKLVMHVLLNSICSRKFNHLSKEKLHFYDTDKVRKYINSKLKKEGIGTEWEIDAQIGNLYMYAFSDSDVTKAVTILEESISETHMDVRVGLRVLQSKFWSDTKMEIEKMEPGLIQIINNPIGMEIIILTIKEHASTYRQVIEQTLLMNAL